MNHRRRFLVVVLAVPVLLLTLSFFYMLGMEFLEHNPRSLWQSMEWATETLTSTGYGGDADWRHPVMVLFVMMSQFAGVLLLFMVFPYFIIPLLEDRFESRLPKEVPSRRDHLVVYSYGSAVTSLLEQAEEAGLDCIVAEENEATARRLRERGIEVVHGELREGVLERAHLVAARALVVNGTDDRNVAAILQARQLGFSGDIHALVEEPAHRQPTILAGATTAVTPRHILAAALAARASDRLEPRVAGVQQLGERLQVREVRIRSAAREAGQTLREAAIGRRFGVTVLAQWVQGRLMTPPDGEVTIEPRGILVVAGRKEALDRFETALRGPDLVRRGPFVIGGKGEVGSKVAQLLEECGESTFVIDHRELEGVDLVGNVLDPHALRATPIAGARAVILALDSDTATIFATVLIRDLAPEVPIIARVNESENVQMIHRAGADFALSLSQVAGQLLARRLLGEEAIAINQQLKLLRLSAGKLAGRSPIDAEIRSRSGCSVVAVERDGELLIELDSELELVPDDTLYLAGSGSDLQRFRDQFGNQE